MSKREYILRYFSIIKKLRFTQEATFNEIEDYLNQESNNTGYKLSISKRTFQRDLDEIRSLFNIDIKYHFSRKVYYIPEDEQLDNQNHRILESFDIMNALNMTNHISSYVLLENRRPLGTEHMNGLLHAIQNHIIVSYDYLKFWEDEPSHRTVEPYALKEFKGRWYLLAEDRKDHILKTFGLDRIHNLTFASSTFKPKISTVKIREQFQHCFGIINPEDAEPEKVELVFDAEQGQYIKTYPLHASQKITKENESEVNVSLNILITHVYIN